MESLARRLPPVNAIVDVDTARRFGWDPLDLARAYLDGGARFLQLRGKRLPGSALLDLSRRFRSLCRTAGAISVINDRADVARLAGADGVHVGQEDLSAAAARALLGSDALVGLSTHTAAQVDAALEEPITYLAVGPIFGTSTKATGYEPVGLDLVRHAAQRARCGPEARAVVAIGGITLETAPEVVAAGADAVAVITDLLVAGDPARRVRAYLERLDPRVREA